MKFCKKCQETKSVTEFYKNSRNKDGLCCYCKKCDNDRKTALLRSQKPKTKYYTLDAQEDLKNGVKYCPKCKQKKKISEFLHNPASSTGIDFHCKECKRLLVKQYGYTKEELHIKYIKNKDSMRNAKLVRNFGITLEEYNRKLAEQNNKCAICGITADNNGKSLAVDHSHKDNTVRGLLCNNCNVALGFVQEDINIARGLVTYIQQYIIKEN